MMGEKNGAILSAILLSEKKEMDAEIKELYQKMAIGRCFWQSQDFIYLLLD